MSSQEKSEGTSAPEGPLAGYWKRAAERSFSLPECAECAHRFLPPRLYCPSCGGDRIGWARSAGAGTLYSYSVVEKAPGPAFAGDAPYVIAVAELDDLSPGSRFYARLVDVDVASLRTGQRVAVVSRVLSEGAQPLPVLVPAEENT